MTRSSRELTKRFVASGCALLLGVACGSEDANFFEGSGGTSGVGSGGGSAGAAVAGASGISGAGSGASAGIGSGGFSGSNPVGNAGSGGEVDAMGGDLGSAGEVTGSAGADPVAGSGGTAGNVAIAGTGGTGGAPVGGIPPVAGKGGGLGKAGNTGKGGSGGTGTCLPLLEVCDGLDNDCDGNLDEGTSCPTGCEGMVLEGRSYMFCLEQARTFASARTRCTEQGMHLAWIESASEDAAILLAIQESELDVERAWIGASDSSEEGEWAWVATALEPGTPFWSGPSAEEGGVPVMGRYTNWGVERPNNGSTVTGEDCATLSVDRTEVESGTWNDDVCSEAWPFVCEKP